MFKAILFVLICVGVVIVGAVDKTCVGPTAPDQNQYLSECCWYDSSTCCSAFVQSIAFNPIQKTMDTLHTQLGNTQCFSTLSAAMCAVCSPTTVSFVSFNLVNSSVRISVCESTCVKAYTDCNGTIPGSNVVQESPAAFCNAIFSSVTSISGISVSFTQTTANCFELPDLGAVKSSHCMLQYFPQTNTSASESSATSSSSPSEGLSPWRIAGICFSIGGVLIAAGAWYMYQRKPSFHLTRFALFKQKDDESDDGEEETDEEKSENTTVQSI